jgi:hypothetical protein
VHNCHTQAHARPQMLAVRASSSAARRRAAVTAAAARATQAAAPALAARSSSVHTEAHIKSLGIELPPPGTPKANYNIACWESPTRLYVSGHLPLQLDGTLITGVCVHDVRRPWETSRLMSATGCR